VPSYSLSGVVGAAPAQAKAYFQPGPSNQTRESVSALEARPDVKSVRATGAISPVSSFSSGVAAAAAASGEDGAGVKPLADILDPRQPFILYTAQPGDSPAAIADRYGITVRTLLDNNPTAAENLLVGQQVVVPRRDGILYKVAYGETVDTIVAQYDNVTSAAVIDYRPNAIGDPEALNSGEYLLLPNATIKPPPPPPPPPEPEPQPAPSNGGGNGGGGSPAPGGNGMFSYPLARWLRVSDPFGSNRGGGAYHTGIDLDLYGMSHSTIFSACDGVVIRTEYLTYSYGYHVIVDCGGGFTTLYGHMSEIDVSPGQRVSAGTPLGLSGVTGYTTGEHLHFEIRINGAPVNPANYLNF
jgi:murein DD-endopeptidase MepM/ murein hydrolase activator NlpD